MRCCHRARAAQQDQADPGHAAPPLPYPPPRWRLLGPRLRPAPRTVPQTVRRFPPRTGPARQGARRRSPGAAAAGASRMAEYTRKRGRPGPSLRPQSHTVDTAYAAASRIHRISGRACSIVPLKVKAPDTAREALGPPAFSASCPVRPARWRGGWAALSITSETRNRRLEGSARGPIWPIFPTASEAFDPARAALILPSPLPSHTNFG